MVCNSGTKRADDLNREIGGAEILQKISKSTIDLSFLDKAPIKKVKSSATSTEYEVEGVTVRLWIISGGYPAIGIGNFEMIKRYPLTDRRWTQSFDDECGLYPHQKSPDDGPDFEVLPEGEKTFREYLKEKWIPYKVRNERMNLLYEILQDGLHWNNYWYRWGELRGKGVRAAGEYKGKLLRPVLDVREYVPPYVRMVNKEENLRLEDLKDYPEMMDKIPNEWKEMDFFLRSTYQKYWDREHGYLKWEVLSDEDYMQFVQLAKKLNRRKLLTGVDK